MQVWVKGADHAFEGWGTVHRWEIDKMVGICEKNDTDPMLLPIIKNPQDMADKRGKATALKEAFHLPLPSVEDIPIGEQPIKPYDVESTATEIKDDNLGECPVHHKPFRKGQYGPHCTTKLEDGTWCKEKPQAKKASEQPTETFGEPPKDEPKDNVMEVGSDAWYVYAGVKLNISDAGWMDLFTKWYKIPEDKLNKTVMGDNLKLLAVNQREHLTKLIQDKAKALGVTI